MRGGKLKNFIKKYGIKIGVSVLAFSVAGIVAFAAYTSTQSVKRVVSTNAGAGQLFSSNYLSELDPKRTVSFTEGTTEPKVNVFICNYAQGDKTRWYENSITYTLTAQLVNSEGNVITEAEKANGFVITHEGEQKNFLGTDYTATFADVSLTKEDANDHSFVITFPSDQLETNDVYVMLTATPTPKESYPDLKPIKGKIGITKSAATFVTSWQGEFTDFKDMDENEYTTGYYGFNYQIWGSGSGTIELTWDASKIDINPFFLEEVDESSSEDKTKHTKTISFKVVSDKQLYTLQFYRTSGTIPEGETVKDVKEYVKFKFTSDADQSTQATTATDAPQATTT